MDLFKKKEQKIKRKKYSFKFQKAQVYSGSSLRYETISDSYLLEKLQQLQNKYDFEIISVCIKDESYISTIVIKCAINDKSKIFSDYCIEVGKYICKVTF